jgi:CAAX protease family protein
MGDLLRFFPLTYAVAWICWYAAWRWEGPLGGLGGPVFLLGVFAPSLVALALAVHKEGRSGALDLLRRIVRWRVPVRWYVFAAGYMAAVKLTVALVLRAVTGRWPQFGATPWYLMAAALLISTWAQAGEEVGWRGYALPRLAARIGLGPAGVVLGIIWACWHLPLFFFPGTDTTGQSFPVYLLQVAAMSVAMAWLYWRTGGSLLVVMLLHAAANNTKDIVPSAVAGANNSFTLSPSPVAWLTVALLWLCAAYFLVRMRRADLAVLTTPAPAAAATLS